MNPVRFVVGSAALASSALIPAELPVTGLSVHVLSLTRPDSMLTGSMSKPSQSQESTLYTLRPYRSPETVVYAALGAGCDYAPPDTRVFSKATDVAEKYDDVELNCGDGGYGYNLFTGERWRLGPDEILVGGDRFAYSCGPTDPNITDYKYVTRTIDTHPLPCHKPDAHSVSPEAAAGIALGAVAVATATGLVVKCIRDRRNPNAEAARPQGPEAQALMQNVVNNVVVQVQFGAPPGPPPPPYEEAVPPPGAAPAANAINLDPAAPAYQA